MSSTIPEPEFCSVDEAARALDISRGLALSLIKRGEIPSRRIGKLYRIPKSYFASETQSAPPPILVPANDAGLALTNLLAALRSKYGLVPRAE